MKLKAIFCILIFLVSGAFAFAQEKTKKKFLVGKTLSVRAIKKEFPKKPDFCGTLDARGTFSVLMEINEKGGVENAKIINGFEMLNKYVQEAVGQWKFQPLKENGKTVPFKGLLILYLDYGCYISETPLVKS